MKALIIIILGIFGLGLLLIAIVFLVGARLPVAHIASRSMLLHRPPKDVYAIVRDFASGPEWRRNLSRVVINKQADGRIRFCEEERSGAVNYELVEDVPGERIVTRILDTDLGYSGKWTYVFTPENGGTRIAITEEGEVANVIFRFMSRYVFGHTATIDDYLNSLAKKFGESSRPQ